MGRSVSTSMARLSGRTLFCRYFRSAGCTHACMLRIYRLCFVVPAAANKTVVAIPACLSSLGSEAQPNNKLTSYLDPFQQLPADADGWGSAAGDQSDCQGGSAGDCTGGLATGAGLPIMGPWADHVVAHQDAASPSWQGALEAQPGHTCSQFAVLWRAPHPQDCPSDQVKACSQATLNSAYSMHSLAACNASVMCAVCHSGHQSLLLRSTLQPSRA